MNLYEQNLGLTHTHQTSIACQFPICGYGHVGYKTF